MEYTIGGKTYFQTPLVLGQWRQLMAILKGVSIPENVDAIGLAHLIGDKLPEALAVVLNPEGVPIKEKDIAALAGDLEFSASPDLAFEVIRDFFDCNPMLSILKRLNETVESIGLKTLTIPSSPSPSPSPEGTSSSETPSSGDTPSTNAPPG